MKKIVLLLIILTIISKFFGFARGLTLSYFYGTSNISDAYLIALTIPTVIFAFIGKSISISYIPIYSMIERVDGEKRANTFTNNLINILLFVCTLLILLGIFFTNQIVKIFASGFESDTFVLAVRFTRISLMGIYFTGLISIFSAFLQIKGNYAIPALISFPMNFCIILSIIASSRVNVMILAIGIVLSTIAQLLYLIPFIIKKGYKYQFVIDIKDHYIKKSALNILPIVIGVSVNDINKIIDRNLASQIAVGGISALNYAGTLCNFVQGVVTLSIATAMYPVISQMAVEKNINGLKKSVAEAIVGIGLLVIPATVGAMIFSEPVIVLLFDRGAFDMKAISMTSDSLFFYAVGMIGIGVREVLSRSFYSLQDAKTPTINGSIAVVINIILNIVLSRYLGLRGLALATSISAICGAILLFISFHKKIGSLSVKSIMISFIKILCASIVMGIIAKLTFNVLVSFISHNKSVLISIVFGALLFFIIIYYMKLEDVDTILNKARIKFKNAVVLKRD